MTKRTANNRMLYVLWMAVLLATTAVLSSTPTAAVAVDLLTPGNTFTSNSHYVSTTVFSWYGFYNYDYWNVCHLG